MVPKAMRANRENREDIFEKGRFIKDSTSKRIGTKRRCAVRIQRGYLKGDLLYYTEDDFAQYIPSRINISLN